MNRKHLIIILIVAIIIFLALPWAYAYIREQMHHADWRQGPLAITALIFWIDAMVTISASSFLIWTKR